MDLLCLPAMIYRQAQLEEEDKKLLCHSGMKRSSACSYEHAWASAGQPMAAAADQATSQSAFAEKQATMTPQTVRSCPQIGKEVAFILKLTLRKCDGSVETDSFSEEEPKVSVIDQSI